MLHSTAGLRQLRCYAERGSRLRRVRSRGAPVRLPRVRRQRGEPRQLYDVRMLAEDLAAAIELARDSEEIDPGRIALWGGSASCAQALDAARRDRDCGPSSA